MQRERHSYIKNDRKKKDDDMSKLLKSRQESDKELSKLLKESNDTNKKEKSSKKYKNLLLQFKKLIQS